MKSKRIPIVRRPAARKTARRGAFWESPTIDELAARQGVKPVRSLDEILGGWPDDELEDGFERAVAAARKAELERGA